MNKDEPWEYLPNALKQALPPALALLISQQCTRVEKLSTGLSNTNYHLHMDGKDWVVRDNLSIAQWCDRNNEVDCWKNVAAMSIAPTLLWISDDKRFYISEFIQQVQFDWSTVYDEFGFNQPVRPTQSIYPVDPVPLLLQLLNQLITLPLPDKVVSLSGQWQIYLDDLLRLAQSQQAGLLTQYHADWRANFQQLLAMQPQMDVWVNDAESCLISPQFCHRDLTPFNLLLKQDKLVCIDFEYCATSHPMFDLASVIASHPLTPQQTDELTSQYLSLHRNLSVDAPKFMLQMMNIFWMYSAAWALMMAGRSLLDAKEHDEEIASYFILFNKYLSLIS
ncbi:hypothetical protein A9267_03895 [Shewanella sp. UCD-FRSSP16_17]|uniref:phosphotransferase n=1 Tax=Shewanella sp. UCD-FRSSP16_17 TaxID=1853256 RepID=UPI0007EEE332|nr:phosphotransferase [Shewanella sp. UCD-FRSSP16_17]OBT11774.1 hypothetical protein A9267_03895 [Shewanella sp. UCD-FRSSP16_17]